MIAQPVSSSSGMFPLSLSSSFESFSLSSVPEVPLSSSDPLPLSSVPSVPHPPHEGLHLSGALHSAVSGHAASNTSRRGTSEFVLYVTPAQSDIIAVFLIDAFFGSPAFGLT
jgi:hypothetical protein